MYIMASLAQQCSQVGAPFPWYGDAVITAIVLGALVAIFRIYMKDRTERKLAKTERKSSDK